MAPGVGKHVPAPDGGAGVQRVFTDLNRKFEEQEAQRRAAALSLPYFDLMGLPIDEEALDLVPYEQAVAAAAVPFFKDGLLLKVAITEPQNPSLKLLLAQLAKRKFQVQIYLVARTALAAALQQYKKILPAFLSLKHEVAVTLGREVLEKFKALPTLGESLLSISASELVGLMLGAAIIMRASDVHLEPEKTQLKVRFRVDGVLAEILDFPLGLQHSLLSRIKLLSNLKLNVTAVAQDGRFTVKLPERNLEIRVSVLPSAHGESVVMRILGMQEVGLDIEKLGLHGQALKVVNHELKKPNGMTLTTGPTGSGKTTTLYSFLNHLNKPGVKIITLEDPVEYQLEGIVQTPIDHTSGVDFASGLRSILRQDPDIVMVGEIRDYETAETASQAALTGHVVLSTLHTNDAAGAIPRLLDLGVKPVTLAPL